MKNKSESFTVKVGDKEVCLHVRRPTPEDSELARMTYNSTFRKCLESGALLKAKLDSYMRSQNLWDDNKENKVKEILATIYSGEKKLSEGNIKLSEAKQIALEMRQARDAWRDLISERLELESKTADGQAQNQEFNHLVSLCTVYNEEGNRYYAKLSDYLNDDSEIGTKAAIALSRLLYNSEESDKDLPENQFLLKYKLVDEKFRLINKEGKLVDATGRLINEEGQWINENGQTVDDKGEVVQEVVFKPFLDDDGNPIDV